MDPKVVVYVDLLGFSPLTEQYPFEVGDFDGYEPRFPTAYHSISSPHETPENPLVDSYVRFHQALEQAVTRVAKAQPTVIAFSDSAFVAVDLLPDAVDVAVLMMWTLLQHQVPVRIGIAHGSLAVVRFSVNAGRPDGSFAAHFLGTGVVRSYAAAEKSGIKGMRILLHHTASALYEQEPHQPHHACNYNPLIWRPLLRCSEEELAHQKLVQSEFNYLSFESADEDWRKNVREMRSRAPTSQHHHHDATLAALARMRHSLNTHWDIARGGGE